MSNVTVCGCGLMGHSLINAFLAKGHHINVVDVNEKCVESIEGTNFSFFKSLKDALDCDFIVFNLPSIDQNMACLEDCKGLLNGKKCVNTTTMTPDQVGIFHQACEEAGLKHLEAKIEAYPTQIGTEEAMLVYSGDYGVFEEFTEPLSALSFEPTYLGENIYTASVADNVLIGLQYPLLTGFAYQFALGMKYDVPAEIIGQLISTGLAVVPGFLDSEYTQVLKDGIPEAFGVAQGATTAVQLHGLQTYMKSLRDADITTEFYDVQEKYFKNIIAAAGADRGIAAGIKLLPNKK